MGKHTEPSWAWAIGLSGLMGGTYFLTQSLMPWTLPLSSRLIQAIVGMLVAPFVFKWSYRWLEPRIGHWKRGD